MNKLITTAFLMVLANVSYGQELIYLHCLNNPQVAERYTGTGVVLVLDNESMKWNRFFLVKDEDLERELDEDEIAFRNIVISGTGLGLEISRIESSAYFLRTATEFISWTLYRITGVLTSLSSNFRISAVDRANCSPIDKASLENLLQERIDLRDEMIRENEARRLF